MVLVNLNQIMLITEIDIFADFRKYTDLPLAICKFDSEKYCSSMDCFLLHNLYRSFLSVYFSEIRILTNWSTIVKFKYVLIFGPMTWWMLFVLVFSKFLEAYDIDGPMFDQIPSDLLFCFLSLAARHSRKLLHSLQHFENLWPCPQLLATSNQRNCEVWINYSSDFYFQFASFYIFSSL